MKSRGFPKRVRIWDENNRIVNGWSSFWGPLTKEEELRRKLKNNRIG